MKRTTCFAVLLCISCSYWSFAAPITSISPNGLGTTVSSTTPGFYIIQGGKVVGDNQFESFSTFSLGTGDTADFIVAPSTQFVLARVTGGTPSSIDGTITSTVGVNGPLSTANLFFINPAGVLFTANARVNLGGGFAVTTGQLVELSDGTYFYGDLQHSTQDQNLSSAPVSAFGFLTPPKSGSAPVVFDGCNLNFQPSAYDPNTKTITTPGLQVFAGNILLKNSSLLSPGSNITLSSTTGSGKVPYELGGTIFGTSETGGLVRLLNSTVAVDSSNGLGNVVIRSGKLVATDSRISAENTSESTGGSIEIAASGIALDGSSISADTYSSGSGGRMFIRASSLLMGDGSTITSDSLYNLGGDAGSFDLFLTGSLRMQDTSSISVSTFASGGGRKC